MNWACLQTLSITCCREIEIQNKQIAAFSGELEYKVKERTVQLNKSNEELQRQNEFVQTILDSSMDIMAVYDKDTRIISFNRACENLYQLKKKMYWAKLMLKFFLKQKTVHLLPI